MAALLAVFQDRLGYTFRNIALLEQALTHRSYAHEVSDSAGDYERLEFLGDAVLGLLVSDYVFTRKPQRVKGSSRNSGRAWSTKGRSPRWHGSSTSAVFYCSVVVRTSMVGATRIPCWPRPWKRWLPLIYLDGGLLQTQEVFWRCFLAAIEQCISAMPDGDYKGVLQTQTLSVFGCIPTYQVLYEEGPAHQKIFHVQLTLNHEYRCVGTGRSKKAAEQHAAQQLLALLQQTRA